MPSMITHAAVGAAAAVAFAPAGAPVRFWPLAVLTATIADADALSFVLHGSYSDMWRHRGFFHSLSFGLVLTFLCLGVFFPDIAAFSGRWFSYFLFFFLTYACHGLLDALTNGGTGVAFFSPFDNTRYFLPWSPILVSPIRLSSFFGKWGFAVLQNEMRWVWLPSFSIAAFFRLIRLLA
jgi:inner membrane protein